MTANSNSKTHLGMKSIKKIKINVWIFVQANESIKRHTLSRPSLCCSSIINSGCFLPIWKKKKKCFSHTDLSIHLMNQTLSRFVRTPANWSGWTICFCESVPLIHEKELRTERLARESDITTIAWRGLNHSDIVDYLLEPFGK